MKWFSFPHGMKQITEWPDEIYIFLQVTDSYLTKQFLPCVTIFPVVLQPFIITNFDEQDATRFFDKLFLLVRSFMCILEMQQWICYFILSFIFIKYIYFNIWPWHSYNEKPGSQMYTVSLPNIDLLQHEKHDLGVCVSCW